VARGRTIPASLRPILRRHRHDDRHGADRRIASARIRMTSPPPNTKPPANLRSSWYYPDAIRAERHPAARTEHSRAPRPSSVVSGRCPLRVYGRPAAIATWATAMTSPASTPNAVKPRMRSPLVISEPSVRPRSRGYRSGGRLRQLDAHVAAAQTDQVGRKRGVAARFINEVAGGSRLDRPINDLPVSSFTSNLTLVVTRSTAD